MFYVFSPRGEKQRRTSSNSRSGSRCASPHRSTSREEIALRKPGEVSCGTVVHLLHIVRPTVTALKLQQLLFSSWRAVLVTRVRRIRLKILFASKRIEANLDLIRLIFACFIFFVYLIFSLNSLIFAYKYSLHFDSNYSLTSISHCCPLFTAHCLLASVYCPFPTVHCPLFTAHCLLPTVYYPLSNGQRLLPIAHWPLSTAHCLLPTVYYPLFTTHCLLANVYCPLSTGQCLLSIAGGSLSIAHCLLPTVKLFTAHCLLPTVYCPLSTGCPLPTVHCPLSPSHRLLPNVAHLFPPTV
jgi:hypothetical protein